MDPRNRTLHHKQHKQTDFIRFDNHLCQACWNCVEACPNDVIGKIDMLFGAHKHAHIDQAERCKGCKKCVQACPTGALTYIYPSSNQAKNKSAPRVSPKAL